MWIRLQGILSIGLWILSFWLPLRDYLSFQKSKANGDPPILSAEWLSLPRTMAASPDPLRGWNEFPSRKVESWGPVGVEGAVPDKIVSLSSVVSTVLERVQLFGVIIEETAPVYCFYDPLREEWFSLSTGEQNMALGIELVMGGDGVSPQLMDMKSGQRYPVRQDDWRLELSGSRVPFKQEPME